MRAAEEAARDRRAADASRKALVAVETALDAREARLRESWVALHSQAAKGRAEGAGAEPAGLVIGAALGVAWGWLRMAGSRAAAWQCWEGLMWRWRSW